MSTYLYLECTEHDPVLTSEDEVGQHLYDLPRVRREIAARDALAKSMDFDAHYLSHYTQNAARFFSRHPTCVITIRDEYGREYPIEDEKVEE